ncbi:hypothetical protein FOE78_08650 [Microlunatus elymi]|uniref:Right handed beta helix domain-containing protein n=1 Tax=Microlunatus elymi TaxID=2596828 RepID=A0A516PXQ8_9ACTN|nr:right-handed parallel beta-helix repeat-containing protein [Microlunatus elymi]QDP95960.1 hypothetical protein FOE78_08650 [Microlunatus elymi]
MTDRIEIYAGPTGSVYGDGSRGYPVQDLQAAITIIRQRRQPGQRAVVWLERGNYPQSAPLVLRPEDSYTSFCAMDPADPPVIEGAVRVTGWREMIINGRPVLAAPAPADRGRALYVNGVRAPRPRHPQNGFLRIASVDGLDPAAGFVETLFDGADRFGFADGDVPELAEPQRVEVVVPHYWVQERMPVAAVDHERREIRSSLRSVFALRDDAVQQFARYYLDNVAEAFGEVPGQWYLDVTGRLSGEHGPQLLYAPRTGETADTLDVRMPVLDQFLRLDGTGDHPVREVRLESVIFDFADFADVPPATAPFGIREDPMLPTDVGYAADVQAASTVPAALQFDGARSCVLLDCTVRRVGGYAVSLGPGSQGNLVSGCRFSDLGAGAIRSGGSIDRTSADFNSDNEISDNEIERGGRSYPSCVAVLLQHGAHNVVAHNHVRDFYYTAISVGWVWDYADSPSHSNLIIGNHLHDLGQRLLNDMGGIYLLGIAPGTIVRGNHIHDVHCANYGGWGIYTDEGSSHVVIESNVVHDVSSQAFHHHYGREVTLRNNILAFGGEGQIAITRPEDQPALTVERNILIGNHSPAFSGAGGARDVRNFRLISDLNLFHDQDPLPGGIRAGNLRTSPNPQDPQTPLALDREWAALGHDRHSIDADPGFADLDARDFRIRPDSPAYQLGIAVPDVSTAGPRPATERRHPLAARTVANQFARMRAARAR